MKKIVLLVTSALVLFAAQANIYMGQTYYAFFLAPKFGIGSEFTKQYTKKEWEELFKNGAQGFYEKFNLDKEMFDKQQLNHLREFMIHYAKDSEAIAVCN